MGTSSAYGSIVDYSLRADSHKIINNCIDSPWYAGVWPNWKENLLDSMTPHIARLAGFPELSYCRTGFQLINSAPLSKMDSLSRNMEAINDLIYDVISGSTPATSPKQMAVAIASLFSIPPDTIAGFFHFIPGTSEVPVRYFGGGQDYIAVDSAKGKVAYLHHPSQFNLQVPKKELSMILEREIEISWSTKEGWVD